MRDLLRASLLSWLGAGATIAAAVMRGKILAVTLGPRGVGAFAQLSGFATLASVVGSFSLGSGIAQTIARSTGEGNRDEQRRIVQSTLVTSTGLGLLLSLIVLASAPQVSSWLFNGDRSFSLEIQVVALGIACMSVSPNLQSALSGYGAVGLSSLTEVVTAVVSVGAIVLLVPFWGLRGAAFALVIIAVARAMTQIIGLRHKHPDVLRAFPMALDRSAMGRTLPSLLKIAAASVIMASGDAAALLFLRTQIVWRYGIEINGFYQGAFGASSQLLVSGLAFVSSYAYATVNSAVTSRDRTDLTNDAFQLALLLVGLGTCLLILLRRLYIQLLLSAAFLPAEKYFAVQAAGEGLKQLGLAIGLGSLLVGGVSVWMAVGLIWAVCLFLSSLALLPLGVWALPLPYCVTALVHFLANWWVVRRCDHFKMRRDNFAALLSAAVLIPVVAWLPLNAAGVTLSLVCVSLWTWLALGGHRSTARLLVTRGLRASIRQGGRGRARVCGRRP